MAWGSIRPRKRRTPTSGPFSARGIATLAFDGPGQGEGEYDFAIRGDYEVAVKAVVDYVDDARAISTPRRIGLWGVSLGGYYAPRAAAFEKRIKACIALGGPYDWREPGTAAGTDARGVPRAQPLRHRRRGASATRATLSLKGVAQNITCPIFVMTGKLDRLIPWQHAERLANEVKGPCTFLLIEDGNHVANNRAYRWRAQSADWLAEPAILRSAAASRGWPRCSRTSRCARIPACIRSMPVSA